MPTAKSLKVAEEMLEDFKSSQLFLRKPFMGRWPLITFLVDEYDQNKRKLTRAVAKRIFADRAATPSKWNTKRAMADYLDESFFPPEVDGKPVNPYDHDGEVTERTTDL